MFKKILLVGFLFATPCAFAQEVFWGFDNDNNELYVPPECDTTFNPVELYEIGLRLLDETGAMKQGASYCLLAAAFGGNVDAQYTVAKMYQRGNGLPKNDLAAYKWATLAALNGHVEADKLGATLEQFLSVEDIEVATGSLETMLGTVRTNNETRLNEEDKKYQDAKAKLDTLNQEISDLQLYGRIINRKTKVATPKSSKKKSLSSTLPKGAKKSNQSIFSQGDLADAPMPEQE